MGSPCFGRYSAVQLRQRAGGIPFEESMFNLMAGRFGLAVASPPLSDFGWNRIVHDFLFRAAKEPLGYTYGVANASDIRRDYWQTEVGALLRSGTPLVANRSADCSKSLSVGNSIVWRRATMHKKIASLGKSWKGSSATSFQTMGTAIASRPRSTTLSLGPDDPGGGGSFINIDISAI
jgi:hypothetical protein